MSAIASWFARQAPDLATTFRRFPLAVVLLAFGTLLLICLLNDWFVDGDEVLSRLMLGVLSGTAYAVAGSLLAESRKLATWLHLLVGAVIPVEVVFCLQIENTTWIVAPMLAVVGVFWMSVAGFTEIGRGEQRADLQDRFWWFNHRAVTTGVVAGVGFLLVALGLFAIDRSLSFLFGLELGDIVYKYILPIAGIFLTPLYWLSTLPRLEEFSRKEIDEPDFLSRAIGFLGQFVLSPLLVIYALILIAYGVQIALVGELPEGVIGWMVLLFVVTGAANWLVLHPGFMHARPTVRWFRQLWFWLTLVPIGLYALAVFERVDAYGLTEERMMLIAGGLWAALLTLAYLTRLAADIRIIPALAGGILLVLAVGPWNIFNAARWDQFNRLDGALAAAQLGDGFEWDEVNAATARGAIRYLARDDQSDAGLIELAGKYGVTEDWSGGVSAPALIDALNVPAETGPGGPRDTFTYLEWRAEAAPTLLTGTPVLYPKFQIYRETDVELANLNFRFEGLDLVVSTTVTGPAETAVAATIVPMDDWIDSQLGEQIRQPSVVFERNGITYRVIVWNMNLLNGTEDSPGEITYAEATLAASASE